MNVYLLVKLLKREAHVIYNSSDGQDKILSIPLRENFCVFMQLPAFSGTDLNIVIVDSSKFQAVWSGDHSSGSLASWRQDSKFLNVETIFLNSEESPFFPASIGDCVDGKFSFVDGITRTIWLLSHEAPYFPLLCTHYAVSQLELLAGADLSSAELKRLLHPATGVGMVR